VFEERFEKSALEGTRFKPEDDAEGLRGNGLYAEGTVDVLTLKGDSRLSLLRLFALVYAF
jgi:hypothetical protein